MSKRFTDECKQNIVDLHKAGLKTPRELSNEYGVSYSVVLKWIQTKKPNKENKLT